jgi:hypothetical protein
MPVHIRYYLTFLNIYKDMISGSMTAIYFRLVINTIVRIEHLDGDSFMSSGYFILPFREEFWPPIVWLPQSLTP